MLNGVRLSPIEGDIVAQLEEAGEEELTVLVNSLDQSGARYPRRDAVLDATEAGLRRLLKLGAIQFVHSSIRGHPPLADEVVAEALDLGSFLSWEISGRYWKVSDANRPEVSVVRGPSLE